MKVYINSQNEIKDVHSTKDESLVMVELPEGVFEGWSDAKILCQKLHLEDGEYRGFAPAVDSRIIEHIDRLGAESERIASDNEMLTYCILELSAVLYA